MGKLFSGGRKETDMRRSIHSSVRDFAHHQEVESLKEDGKIHFPSDQMVQKSSIRQRAKLKQRSAHGSAKGGCPKIMVT